MEEKIERLRVWHSDGREYFVDVAFASLNQCQVVLGAYYGGNDPEIEVGKKISLWPATYEPSNPNDEGHTQIGDGRIELEIEALRGTGLGSLLMRPLVMWIKSRAEVVPVVPINLAANDAKSMPEQYIRNRFYEKLAFKFGYRDEDRTWGESLPMLSSELIVPAFQLSRGWAVESVGGVGQIF